LGVLGCWGVGLLGCGVGVLGRRLGALFLTHFSCPFGRKDTERRPNSTTGFRMDLGRIELWYGWGVGVLVCWRVGNKTKQNKTRLDPLRALQQGEIQNAREKRFAMAATLRDGGDAARRGRRLRRRFATAAGGRAGGLAGERASQYASKATLRSEFDHPADYCWHGGGDGS